MKHDHHLLRSWLFVPGDSERKMQKCWQAGADALIFDLEDAVASPRKTLARDMTREAIAGAASRRDTFVAIRLNAADTGLAEGDIEHTLDCRPDAYVLPKANSPEDIQSISHKISRHELRHGLPEGSVALVPIITEHPSALRDLHALCAADARTAAVIWGTEDLSAAIGTRRVKDERHQMLPVFQVVRAMVLLAASAAGVAIIDTPVVELDVPDILERESREAYETGFTGKLAIHPGQVAPINQAFLPNEAEAEYARALLEAARATPDGAFRFRDKMMDMPHLRMAERVIALLDAHGNPGAHR